MTPASDAVAPELDALTITIVVDNATDTLSSIGPGVPQLPEMAYLLGAEPMGQHDGHNCVVTLDHLCVACHGFSALAEARAGDQVATVLFDVGPYGDVWLANAERLSVDLAAIDVLFLSHWHWDHSGGIPTVVEAIAAARSRAGRPPLVVDVHPDRPDQRGHPHPARRVRDAPARTRPSTPSRPPAGRSSPTPTSTRSLACSSPAATSRGARAMRPVSPDTTPGATDR